MATYAPARYVAAPAVVPHRFGLFSVASVLEPADEEWANGIEFEPEQCAPASIAGVACEAPFGTPKTGLVQPGVVTSTPFAVYGSWKCSFVGHWEDAEQRALNHLLLGEERAVERALHRAQAGNTLSYQGATDLTPTPGTAINMVAAVGILEAWLGLNHSGLGMIHANPREVTRMAASHLISDRLSSGTQLATFLGTPVGSEAGMSGLVGPAGTTPAAGAYWLYAGGIPIIRRTSPITVSPRESALNRANNDLIVLVERIYVAAWQCGTAAILVNEVTGA